MSDWVQVGGPKPLTPGQELGQQARGEFLGTPAHTSAGFICRSLLRVSL